jgi:hypothetical protein
VAAAIARQVGTGFAQLDGPPVRVTATARGGVAAVRAIVGD